MVVPDLEAVGRRPATAEAVRTPLSRVRLSS